MVVSRAQARQNNIPLVAPGDFRRAAPLAVAHHVIRVRDPLPPPHTLVGNDRIRFEYHFFAKYSSLPPWRPNSGNPEPTTYLEINDCHYVCIICLRSVHFDSPHPTKLQLITKHSHRSSSSIANTFILPLHREVTPTEQVNVGWRHRDVQIRQPFSTYLRVLNPDACRCLMSGRR